MKKQTEIKALKIFEKHSSFSNPLTVVNFALIFNEDVDYEGLFNHLMESGYIAKISVTARHFYILRNGKEEIVRYENQTAATIRSRKGV